MKHPITDRIGRSSSFASSYEVRKDHMIETIDRNNRSSPYRHCD